MLRIIMGSVTDKKEVLRTEEGIVLTRGSITCTNFEDT